MYGYEKKATDGYNEELVSQMPPCCAICEHVLPFDGDLMCGSPSSRESYSTRYTVEPYGMCADFNISQKFVTARNADTDLIGVSVTPDGVEVEKSTVVYCTSCGYKQCNCK